MNLFFGFWFSVYEDRPGDKLDGVFLLDRQSNQQLAATPDKEKDSTSLVSSRRVCADAWPERVVRELRRPWMWIRRSEWKEICGR